MKEKTAEYIKVMQAYLDGEEIECSRYAGIWDPVNCPLWNFDEFDYRVKPKPRSVYIPKDVFDAYYNAEKQPGGACYGYIKVREVIE